MPPDIRRLIVSAYERGDSQAKIYHALKHFSISRQYISYTVKRWRECGIVADRPRSGRPRSVRTTQLVQRIKRRIARNCRRSGRKMARDLQTSCTTLRRVLHEDLGLRAFKRRRVHGLTAVQKAARLLRCKRLLRRFTNQGVKSIVFSDEKIFSVKEQLNAQNDRVYALSVEDIPQSARNVQHFQSSSNIMVWAAISSEGKFPIVFISSGTKVNKEYYREKILQKIVKPSGEQMFKNRRWTFQQDSAPSHSAKVNQVWCEENLPDFISSSEWPSSSPDLNPMDYSIWGTLQTKINVKSYTSVHSLKCAILREWKKLPMDFVRSAIESWRPRLRACVAAGGGRFE